MVLEFVSSKTKKIFLTKIICGIKVCNNLESEIRSSEFFESRVSRQEQNRKHKMPFELHTRGISDVCMYIRLSRSQTTCQNFFTRRIYFLSDGSDTYVCVRKFHIHAIFGRCTCTSVSCEKTAHSGLTCKWKRTKCLSATFIRQF